MSSRARVVSWLRTGDSELPRAARAARRQLVRIRARRTHGSVAAYMESVVADANRAVVGSAFPQRHRPRTRRRAA